MPDALSLALISLVISLVAVGIAIRVYRDVKVMKTSLAVRLAETAATPTRSGTMPEATPGTHHASHAITPEKRTSDEGRAARRERGTRRDAPHGSANSRGPTLINVPDLSMPSPASPAISANLANRFGAIWSMSDEGILPEAIAHRTGLPVGQVELILGLRRPRAAEPRS